MKTVSLLPFFLNLICAVAKRRSDFENPYPVPIPPGGRFDVHGWLILPVDQDRPDNSVVNELDADKYAVTAWFSHHVPELWDGSPHNFQIILKGKLRPMSCVAGDVYPFEIPYPPEDNMLVYEYSFTPPSPFSLNDLLSGDIKHLRGVYYNGSFDTPYERQASSLAMMDIDELTTAVYLNESEHNNFQYLQYLSYPRGNKNSEHFYFAHEIHSQPDFDHIVHGEITSCVNSNEEEFINHDLVYVPGTTWIFPGIENNLENKLTPGQVLPVILQNNPDLRCTFTVLESIHCMIGPDFMDNC